jgi:acyl carrier protein
MSDDTRARLVAFLRDATATEDLSASTPLLESGLLDSLRMAMLLNFIRVELGVRVPAAAIEYRNFRDAEAIGAMVHAISPGSPA